MIAILFASDELKTYGPGLSQAGFVCADISEAASLLNRTPFTAAVVVSPVSAGKDTKRIRALEAKGVKVAYLWLVSVREKAGILPDACVNDEFALMPMRTPEFVLRLSKIISLHFSGVREDAVKKLGPLTLSRWPDTAFAGSTPVALTAKEFSLLSLLADYAGTALSRETIEQILWPELTDDLSRTVDIHISRLRKKIFSHPDVSGSLALEQIHGFGYRLSVR